MIVMTKAQRYRLLGLAEQYSRAAGRLAAAEARLARAIEATGAYEREGIPLGRLTVWLERAGSGPRLGHVVTARVRVEGEA